MRIISRSTLAMLPVVLSTLLSGCVVYDDPYAVYAPPAPIRFETYDPTPYYYNYYRYYDRPRWGGGGGWGGRGYGHGYHRGYR